MIEADSYTPSLAFHPRTGALERLTPISAMAFHQFEVRYRGSAMVLRRFAIFWVMSDVTTYFNELESVVGSFKECQGAVKAFRAMVFGVGLGLDWGWKTWSGNRDSRVEPVPN